MIDINEYPCPECGYEGPHITIDDSALECGNCCTSINISESD
jgi:hypothetical protein